MFYSQFILAKKGPLGTIWIAAHLERKLRKNQVADTDIGVSVDSIIFPEAPIALRLSSHLLLGVVRIYSRKVGYLFDDCSEALLKVKQAFRSTAVDLPPEESKAPYHSITLPETFELDDFELPDNEIIQGNYVDHHISSRDQITLQDTMEGVIYSTSKFGLDERFGDGDTSGLDLEEELFLDEVAAAGEASVSADPHASVEPMTPLKQDENREGMAANSESMIDGTDGDADLMDQDQDHDHAPCTPGLAEEPNLSNIQETSACEDQLGLEDRHLMEYAAKGNSENPPFENNVNNGSGLLENQAQTGSSDADTLHYVARDENGYHLRKQQEPDGQLSPSGVAFDPVDPALAPETLSAAVHEVAKSSSAVERAEEIVAASDGQANWWNLQCGVSGMDKGGISTPAGLHAEPLLPYGISSTKVDHDVSALNSICQQVPEDISLSNQRSLEAVSNNVEIPGNLEAGEFRDISCLETPKISLTNQTSPETVSNNAEIPGNLEAGESLDVTCLETPKIAVTNQRSAEAVSNNVVIPGSMGIGESQGITCLETLKANDCEKQSGFAEDGIGAQVHFLSRCNSAQIDASKSKCDRINNHEPLFNFSGFHPPEISREEASHGLGETCPATGDSEQISKKNLVEEPVSCGDIRKDSDKSNYQVDNMVLEDRQMENMSGSTVSAFPAPEKFLSMSGGFVNLPSIFPEATPGYLVGINGADAGITTPGYLVGINGADAGSKFMPGRKRCYTESTLTEQSFNSAESSRMDRFRKTTGVIPDDDDLLSSILVGRKSSALKLKPTPPPSEITSSKRPRSAARMTASKRRVLMDDTMVLHGDMIRQQLIDAEDIRRMRKKAPCTHAEISAIQKQLLEDAIFREAVLTGLSVELASLHKQTFDLSRVRVSLTEVSCSQSEVVVDPQLISEYAKNPILNLDEQHTMRFNEQHAERDSVMGGSNERYVGRDSSIKLGGVDATVPTENREVDNHDQHLSSINLDEQHTVRFNEHVERESVMGGNNELYVGGDGSINLGGVDATVPAENREVHNHEQLLSSNAYERRPDTVAEVAGAGGFHFQPSNNAAEVQPQGTCLSGAEVAAEATDIAAAEATDIASTGEVLLSCPNSGRLDVEGGAIAGLLLSNSFDDSRREDTSILAEVSCGSPSLGLTAQADKAPENLNNKSLSPAGLLLTFDDSRREDTSILAEVSCGSPSHGLTAQGDMAPENLNNKSLSPNCGLNAQVDKALENLNSENLVDDSYWPENNYYFTTEAEAGTESRVADAVVYDASQDSAAVEATATIIENIVPGNDNQNFVDKGTGTEQSNNAGASNEEMSVHTLDHSIGAGEYPCQEEDFSYNMTGAHFSDANMVDLNDLDYSAAENDTGFLNFDDDDDEEAEAADDDYVPDAEVTHINENSGWSSRTRAVSKYLQTLFVKESERGRKSLSMDSLLVGKTRKEASRMFFETLVLKTRDYIHVEQVIPFDDVTIKPRTKLLKSNF